MGNTSISAQFAPANRLGASAPKILPRPKAMDPYDDSTWRVSSEPGKTLQEKQQEYAEVRARIFARDSRGRGRSARSGRHNRGRGRCNEVRSHGGSERHRGHDRSADSWDYKADPDYDRNSIRYRNRREHPEQQAESPSESASKSASHSESGSESLTDSGDDIDDEFSFSGYAYFENDEKN